MLLQPYRWHLGETLNDFLRFMGNIEAEHRKPNSTGRLQWWRASAHKTSLDAHFCYFLGVLPCASYFINLKSHSLILNGADNPYFREVLEVDDTMSHAYNVWLFCSLLFGAKCRITQGLVPLGAARAIPWPGCLGLLHTAFDLSLCLITWF